MDWRHDALPPKAKVVHGEDLLYRFLLDLFALDEAAYGHVPQLMLVQLQLRLRTDSGTAAAIRGRIVVGRARGRTGVAAV